MGFSKKNSIDMGNYISSVREQAAFEWCINNGIYISPKPKSTTEWHLSITINGKTNVSPGVYKKIDIWKQLYIFYLYYYNKYSGIKETLPIVKQQKKETKAKQQSNDKQLF